MSIDSEYKEGALLEKEIYIPELAIYADSIKVFILNEHTNQLELYQTQQISPNSVDYMQTAISFGLELIIKNNADIFNRDGRTFHDILLTRALIDPFNVIRVAYVDPDRIEIIDGKLQPVMVTYGVIQLPDEIGLDISSGKSLFDLTGKDTLL